MNIILRYAYLVGSGSPFPMPTNLGAVIGQLIKLAYHLSDYGLGTVI